jgi:anthranilate synthase component 2
LKKIALIDNYDSFTYNLVHLIEKVSDATVHVFLNDKVSLETLASFNHIVISPGPGLPSEAGITPLFLKEFASSKNILGVCLGMQAIGEKFQSPLKNLDLVMHGISTPITHSGNDFLFKDIPATFNVGRYHSWVIDQGKIHPSLETTAKDKNGEIMAIRHKDYNIHGVQFHPESILSEYGEQLLKNWTDSL